MLVIFLFAVTEYPWEQLHGGRVSFGLQFEGIQLMVVDKVWWQEPRGLVSAVRGQW